ncbi:MAG: polyphosphate kinase 1 [Chitinophagales bacterium]|nr:polyphosphate kinase 1 [Chitinophagales bacterium]
MAEKKYVFLNRDLSWLSFNYRVLLEAADRSVPLYNRLSFLSIFSSNLDEFFRVRMPSILAFTGIKAKKTALRDEYPLTLAKEVQETVQVHLEEFGRILSKEILPELEKNSIHLCYDGKIKKEHKERVREYFLTQVLSFLQPVILRKHNQNVFFLENNVIYFLVEIEFNGQPGKTHYALVNIPSGDMPRFLQLSPIGDVHHIVFLDDVIKANLTELFLGHVVKGAWSIKLTRNAEMELQDEFAGDIAEKIEKQLEKRDAGSATRLLFDKELPDAAKDFLQRYLQLHNEEMVEGGRYHNLKDLGDLPNPSGKKLTYDKWPPIPHPGFNNHSSIFESISESEKILHLPYQSYNYVLRFFNEAAIDPAVKEVCVTLYRVAANSHIVNALISAAKNGKKVVVFVELKARFDEANNLKWSKKMKAAGVTIINSIPDLKVHAKVALVKRKENNTWKNYSVMATGNFNETTGKFYGDHVFFSADDRLSHESAMLFDYLQSRKQPKEYGKIAFRHLLVSQFNILSRFNKMIDREIRNAKKGKEARIIIKVNNLQEKKMISKLYKASIAGVKVDVIARSICCLAPGIEGQSENITVHRIVDRYLEHARIFIFHNDGDSEYYMGSADWMNRNLHNRIEVVFPLYNPSLNREIDHIIQLQLADHRKGCVLNASLENIFYPEKEKAASISSQQATYEFVKANA